MWIYRWMYVCVCVCVCVRDALFVCKRYIVCPGDYRECTIVLWSTYTYTVLTSTKTSQPIHELKWDPYTVNEFASVGDAGTLSFWLLDETQAEVTLSVHEAQLPHDLLGTHHVVSVHFTYRGLISDIVTVNLTNMGNMLPPPFSRWTWLSHFPLGFLCPHIPEENLHNKWHKFFYQLCVLPVTQPTVSEHWRELRAVTATVGDRTLVLSVLDSSPDSWEKRHCSLYVGCPMPALCGKHLCTSILTVFFQVCLS